MGELPTACQHVAHDGRPLGQMERHRSRIPFGRELEPVSYRRQLSRLRYVAFGKDCHEQQRWKRSFLQSHRERAIHDDEPLEHLQVSAHVWW